MIRKITREDKAATQLFPTQRRAESVAIPDAHMSFMGAFSRIGGHLPPTMQDGTTPNRGSLRARCAADAAIVAQGAAIVAQGEVPAREGRLYSSAGCAP